MSFENIDRAALTAWVRASCARQGVPVKITNPLVIATVATVLTGGRSASRFDVQARHSGTIRPESTVREPGVPGRIVA